MIQLTHEGKTLSLANWARLRGLHPETVRVRKKRGWTDAQCLGFADPPRKPISNTSLFSKPLSFRKSGKPPDKLIAVTRLVEVIDSYTIAIEAKRIRRGCGVTQEQASVDMGMSKYASLENGNAKWTAELVAKFNAVAAGWVVSDETT
jgi:hypothetical protein